MIRYVFLFFSDPATTCIYTYGHTLSLHDALPICSGDRAYAEHDPQGRHALVDPFHGRQVRAVTHHHPPDLGRVRPAAAPVRDIQAVHRSATCRQGAGHSRALHVAAEPGDSGVLGGKIAHPGAGSRGRGLAPGCGGSCAELPYLPPTRHDIPLLPPRTTH